MSWFSEKLGNKASARLSAPLARTEDLVVEDFSDEVLIYDQRSDQAHCLSREAAMVWRVCDGRTPVAELATALGLDHDVVVRAVEELETCGLLDSAPATGVTRREATLRMARVGGAAMAAPLIYSIAAPTPALAASQNFCVGLGCVPNANVTDACGYCHQNCCACCGPGNNTGGGAAKLCTADCSTTYCYPGLINSHCGTAYTGSACNIPGHC